MRLTLRDLLRLVDHNQRKASPGRELEQFVERHPRARQWLKRVQRARDGRPTPIIHAAATGMGDAASVAAYLDGTLDDAAAEEFERRALVDDVLLADLVASHAALHGPPAAESPRISIQLREAVYAIGHAALRGTVKATTADDAGLAMDPRRLDLPFVDDQPAETSAAGSDGHAVGAAVSPSSITSSATIQPAASRSRRWVQWGVALALVGGLVAVAYYAGRQAALQTANLPATLKDVPTDLGAEPAATGSAAPAQVSGTPTAAEEVADDVGLAADGEPSALDDAPPVPAAGGDQSAQPAASDTASAPASTDGAAEPASDEPPRPVVAAAADDEPAPDAPALVTTDTPPRPRDTTGAILPIRIPVARLAADDSILLRWEAHAPIQLAAAAPAEFRAVAAVPDATEGWVRLAAGSTIFEGDQLLVGHSLTATIRPTDLVSMRMFGPAKFSLPYTADAPAIEWRFGVMELTAAAPQRTVVVVVDQQPYTIKLIDPATRVVFDSFLYRAPGSDPQAGGRHRIVQLIVVDGRAQLECAAGGTPPLSQGSGIIVDRHADMRVGQVQDSADWIAERFATTMLTGADDIADALPVGRPAVEAMYALTEHPRVEVARTAIKNWLDLGYWHVFWDKLASDQFDSRGQDLIDAALFQLANDAEQVARCDKALAELTDDNQPQTGQFVRELLVGFSAEQLASGKDQQLVDLLDNESKLVRILAIDSLRRITGQTRQYRPESEGAQRRARIRAWRTVQERDTIRYEVPPAPPVLNLIDQPVAPGAPPAPVGVEGAPSAGDNSP